MWHTTEIITIMREITKKYGYDVFQNRKLCVALCGDLLAHYEQERYILQMLFQAGFGETLAEIPFTTEQKLKIGIARVNTFLQKQAIAQDVRICIIEIVQKAFASDNILIKNISIQPIITKSYNELHFRLMLPEMHEFSNRLEFITTFQYRDLSPNIDTIFEKAIYTDSLNLSHALNLINLAGTYCAADKNTDGSRFNIVSAILAFSTAISIDQNEISEIGIITPYAAQARLIRAMLKDYYKQNTSHISCATVHQFQGSESDIVIFDAVESYPKSAVGYLMGKDPDNIIRLINVAVTRAKGKLITIANDKFWENLYKGTNHVLYKLLCHIKKSHKVISQDDNSLIPYIQTVNPGKSFQLYTNEDAAIFMLENDLEKAKGQVIVSLPSGNLRETQEKIILAIDEAHKRGIDILMKSNEYSILPNNWKKYCLGTENATFPIIVIDDETIWYGLPTANWIFKVNNSSSLRTVVHIMIRIKGKNTIEMIKSLTELELIQVGINKRPLLKKESFLITDNTNDSIKSGCSTTGLAAFIEKKEFCPDCKSHMILTKNQKGTAYLKCSNKNCKKMKYLTTDIINWYITSHNIICPKEDNGKLTGILGKYGPCIKCSCGHFLKPEEI